MTNKVQNMTSKNGNKIANQFIIWTDNGSIFQSYESTICQIELGGSTYLDINKWNYSKTTAKYRNIFLCESTKETEDRIKSGEYILTDLNKKEI